MLNWCNCERRTIQKLPQLLDCPIPKLSNFPSFGKKVALKVKKGQFRNWPNFATEGPA